MSPQQVKTTKKFSILAKGSTPLSSFHWVGLRSSLLSRMFIVHYHSPKLCSSFLVQSCRNLSFCMKEYLGQLAWEVKKRKKQSLSQLRRINSTSSLPIQCTEIFTDALYKHEADKKDMRISSSARAYCPRYGQENVNLAKKTKYPFLLGCCNSFLFSSLKGVCFHAIDFLALLTTLGLIFYTFVFTVGTTLMNF